MLCWPGGLISKGRNASTGRHSNDVTEVKVKTATFGTLYASESKKGVTVLSRVTESDYHEKSGQFDYSRYK